MVSVAQEVRDADDRICLHMSVYAYMPVWSCLHRRRAKVNLLRCQFGFDTWFLIGWSAKAVDPCFASQLWDYKHIIRLGFLTRVLGI